MTHETIKSFFNSAVRHVADNISQYVVNPLKDFTRNRKITPEKLITFLVTQGSSSTRNEMADFFDMDASMPTEAALARQRAKLKPEALEAVFKGFNSLAASASGGTADGLELNDIGSGNGKGSCPDTLKTAGIEILRMQKHRRIW